MSVLLNQGSDDLTYLPVPLNTVSRETENQVLLS